MQIFEKIKPGRDLVVGVGSALVDMLAHEDDAFLEKTEAAKGGMILVGKEFIENALTLTSAEPKIVPGGSACNMTVGVGKLGGKARFVGKCGSGGLAQFFRQDLIKQNVEPKLFASASPTGRVLSIITPDAQRSMFTYLGASSEIQPHELTQGCFDSAAIVHIEGYLIFNPDLILSALKAAKAAGAVISLDLASFTVVEESKERLVQLVADYVDILIANDDEVKAFTGCADESDALEAFAETATLTVVNVGRRGSYISHNRNVLKIDAIGDGSAVDTTGAGDLWTAGFLYGLVNGYPLHKCGLIGTACGYEVCQVVGAAIPDNGWGRIKKLLNE